MKKIKIFTDNSIEIDLSTFVDSRALLCANSGGGKSYAIRKLLEKSHGKVMALVLDVEGEFKTLREKFDFLLIGSNGDVPITIKSASLLPKNLLELNVSTIIDISDLKRRERIDYVKKFLESLMELPRKLWKPCLVVLDEAHLLCGQQEKQDSYTTVIDLMTRGRKRGYCGILCTQRVAKLHKDAVAEANNIMIGRTGLDIDMKRAAEILGFTSKTKMLSLRDLHPGEFYVFGTAISRHVTKAKISEVVTMHPKVGMDLKTKIVQPTQKIKNMLSKLTDLPKEAKKELKTLQDMKKEVHQIRMEKRKLEFEIKKKKPELDPKQLEAQYNKGLGIGYNKALKEGNAKIQEVIAKIKPFDIAFTRIAKIISEFKDVKFTGFKIESTPMQKTKMPDFKIPTTPASDIYPKEKTQPTLSIEDDDNHLNLCSRKIYSFLFANSERGFTKVQIGAITGYSIKSGGFNNALGALNSKGLIKRNGNKIQIGNVDPELATEKQENLSIELWLHKLGKCPREIFKLLLENPHEEYPKEELGELTGYSARSGGFNNALGKLNALGLIIRIDSKIKLNPEILEL